MAVANFAKIVKVLLAFIFTWQAAFRAMREQLSWPATYLL